MTPKEVNEAIECLQSLRGRSFPEDVSRAIDDLMLALLKRQAHNARIDEDATPLPLFQGRNWPIVNYTTSATTGPAIEPQASPSEYSMSAGPMDSGADIRGPALAICATCNQPIMQEQPW